MLNGKMSNGNIFKQTNPPSHCFSLCSSCNATLREHQVWQLTSLTPLSLSVPQLWGGDEEGRGRGLLDEGGEVGEKGSPVGTV